MWCYMVTDFLCSHIPVDDMGHLYGFGLFETFLVNKNSSVLLLDRHIDRLFKSISFFDFDIDIKKDEFEFMLLKHIENNRIKDKVLRVSITYGNKYKNIKPSMRINLRDNPYISKEIYSKGFKLTVSKYKKNESSPIISHKTANYMENYLACQHAVQNGFDDTIFLNTKNKITETTKSNIFFISNGIIYTPDIRCGILPGIIRDWIIEKSEGMGIKCQQGKYTIKMLMESDEIFVTNSVMGIMPVYCVEDYVMTGGLPGKITNLFLTEYQKKMG